MQSRSRLPRTAVLSRIAALESVILAACSSSPNNPGSNHPEGGAPDGAAERTDAPADDSDGGSTTNGDASPHADGLTLGCGLDPNQPLGMYFEYHISIAGPDLDTNNQPKVRDRIYYLRLPANYDRTVPYRVAYLAPGCGGNTYTEVFSLYKASGDNAILVAMMPLPEFGGCFDETMNSVEYPFFDALHKKIESQFCVDTDRQFYAGYSTGARLGFMLDCAFPDVLRATATVQGALPPLPPCKNHPIAGFFLADTLELGNPYQSNVMAAARVFTQNGCAGTFMSPMPPTGCGTACSTYDTGATPLPPTMTCVNYAGCPVDYPIVFCSTTGQGKLGPYEVYLTSSFLPWADQALWNFFKQF
jgi:hypothetical protein